MVTVGSSEVLADFVAYQSNALTIEMRGSNVVRAVYAGEAGSAREVLSSSNLVDWEPFLMRTVGEDGLFEFTVKTKEPLVRFFKVRGP